MVRNRYWRLPASSWPPVTSRLRARSAVRTSVTVRPRSASADAASRICTWRSAPPQTSTLETPSTVSIRVRTLSETKSRIMSMSSPRGLPSSGATRKYMNELLEKDSAKIRGWLTVSG